MTALLADRIRAALAQAGDPQRAVAQQRYMKSTMPFRGVRVPEVRRTVSRVLDADGPCASAEAMEMLALELWVDAGFREERYAALAVCRYRRHGRFQTPERVPLYRRFVEEGAWWDLVDETAHLIGALLVCFPVELTPIMREWSRADSLWVRRVAIICQLGRGADTDLALLTEAIDANAADPDFFIRKAIGWALRQHARTDPDWVRAFVAVRSLSALSVREALKHLG